VLVGFIQLLPDHIYVIYITRYHHNLGTYCIQATPSCTTHAKVEPFKESQSWALLSNSFHSSLPGDLLWDAWSGIQPESCAPRALVNQDPAFDAVKAAHHDLPVPGTVDPLFQVKPECRLSPVDSCTSSMRAITRVMPLSHRGATTRYLQGSPW